MEDVLRGRFFSAESVEIHNVGQIYLNERIIPNFDFSTMNPSEISLPASWDIFLDNLSQSARFSELSEHLTAEYSKSTVFPEPGQVFEAFRLCSPEEVRVVILGQDPYHGEGEAHGLAFSVREGVKLPPSLRNIFKEIKDDCGAAFPGGGDLSPWAARGVFLMNASLTVRANEAGSHRKLGWETITDEIIRQLSAKKTGLVFMLWGNYARAKAGLIDAGRHLVLLAPHPSPLSAYQGFFGCRHFSRANAYLLERGGSPISWSIP